MAAWREKEFCRICYEGSIGEHNPLIAPCACTGSRRLVHLGCLKTWQRFCLQSGNKKRAYTCNVCKTTLRPAPHPTSVFDPLVFFRSSSLHVAFALLSTFVLAVCVPAGKYSLWLVVHMAALVFSLFFSLHIRGLRLEIVEDRFGRQDHVLAAGGAPSGEDPLTFHVETRALRSENESEEQAFHGNDLQQQQRSEVAIFALLARSVDAAEQHHSSSMTLPWTSLIALWNYIPTHIAILRASANEHLERGILLVSNDSSGERMVVMVTHVSPESGVIGHVLNRSLPPEHKDRLLAECHPAFAHGITAAIGAENAAIEATGIQIEFNWGGPIPQLAVLHNCFDFEAGWTRDMPIESSNAPVSSSNRASGGIGLRFIRRRHRDDSRLVHVRNALGHRSNLTITSSWSRMSEFATIVGGTWYLPLPAKDETSNRAYTEWASRHVRSLCPHLQTVPIHTHHATPARCGSSEVHRLVPPESLKLNVLSGCMHWTLPELNAQIRAGSWFVLPLKNENCDEGVDASILHHVRRNDLWGLLTALVSDRR